MAKSQYEYVKQFELSDAILPACWIVVRIDGVGFTKFTAAHALTKPNDQRAMQLMNTAARAVCTAYPDIVLAQGMSDEYSFVIHPQSAMYNRRSSKINSAITSLFTSTFVFQWSAFFPDSPLRADNLPWFDGRCVAYPTDAIVKDYLRWRQVDVHINNLYNTCFWALVHDHLKTDPALSEKAARERAHASMNSIYASSAAKHEMLFTKFQRNYNDEAAVWRKGSILVWTMEKTETEGPATATASGSVAAATQEQEASTAAAASTAAVPSVASPAAASSSSSSAASPSCPAGRPSARRVLTLLHCDLIAELFWTVEHPGIVPYRSATQMKKDDKAADKAEKKAAHKRREKEEKHKAAAEKSTAGPNAVTDSVASLSAPSASSASSSASSAPAAPSQPA